MECLQRLCDWGCSWFSPNNDGVSERIYRSDPEDDNEFDDTSPFDESFLLNISHPPGPWIARPVSICGRTASPYFRNKDLIVSTLINVAAAGAFTGLGLVLSEESERDDFSVRDFSIPLILISAVFQSALELNAAFVKGIEARIVAAKPPGEERTPLEKVVQGLAKVAVGQEYVYNFLARHSTENFLYLWNAYLNVPARNKQASQGLYYSNVVLSVLLLTRNFFNLKKLRRGHHVDPLHSLERGTPVNRRLSPSSGNIIGKLVPYGVELGAGLLCWGLGGYFKDEVEGLELLSYSLGTIAIGDVVGFFTAEALQTVWQRLEVRWIRDGDLDVTGSLNASPEIPTSLFITRRGIKVLRISSVVIVCLSAGFVPVHILSPFMGFFKGIMDQFQSQQFEYFTQEDLSHIREESFVPGTETKLTAVRVNQAATATFFTIFHAFFAYALVESDDKERAEIAAFIAATDLSAIVSRYLQYKFKPGENRIVFNQAVYDLLFNPYDLAVYYFAFSAVGGATGSALGGEATLTYGAGIAAQIIFGLILGANQTREFRGVTFTPSIFDAQAGNLLLGTLITNSL
jgi:hypothetical protein